MIQEPRVGVRQFYPRILPDTLKQQLLFFDQILIPDLPKLVNTLYKDDVAFQADLEWLGAKGVIKSLDTPTLLGSGTKYEPVWAVEPIRAEDAIFTWLTQNWADKWCRTICVELTKASRGCVPILSHGIDDLAHLFASEADLARASEKLPQFKRPDYIGEPGDVISVVIKALPRPDELTSWEDVLEFRSDTDASEKMLALRRWMRKAANDIHSAQELSEELQWLLQEYEKHMELHRLKINHGALETFIGVTAEFAEDFLKLKWGKLAKLPFILKHRRIELLEAEATAPGREIAYISKAAHTYQKPHG